MAHINPFLLKDFYKAVHSEMIPKTMTKSVSYLVPRMSRFETIDHMVVFGIQAFCKTWLIDYFNEYFFSKPLEEVLSEYKRVIDNTLGKDVCDYSKLEKLHKLGYLPIEIIALPEGSIVPMKCPIFGITNTHKDFAWLGQALESLISAELWYPMICATIGHKYREIVNKYYDETCDEDVPRRRALGNFDFRGDHGLDAALKAGSAWCLSFVNSATVPVIPYLEQNYNCDYTKEEVAFGAISTEHFVMCSNSAKDILDHPKYGYENIDPYRERSFIKKLLTQIYPDKSFSVVCDSYDYWNVVENILPTLKSCIMAHNGTMFVRGDSGNCVEVVTQTVFKLWDMFGGTINSKGYKVLDNHIRALYGDSITIQRAEEIYQILKDNGFAANNVSLGIGSFSMHCIEENGVLKPFTRDSFSVAIKAVYAEFEEKGKIIKLPIFKDPKTDRDTGNGFKKSNKGCCIVTKENDEFVCKDEFTYEDTCVEENLLKPIFIDGKMVKEESLSDIRNRLNNNQF